MECTVWDGGENAGVRKGRLINWVMFQIPHAYMPTICMFELEIIGNNTERRGAESVLANQ